MAKTAQLYVQEDSSPSNTRRKFVVLSIVIAVIAIALGIVIGYFVGHKAGKDAANTPAVKVKKDVITSMKEKASLHKAAVEDVSPDQLRENLRYFTKVPHVPGSKETYDQALYIKQKWLSYGFDKVELKKYQVLLSFPDKPGVISVSNKEGVLSRTVIRTTFLEPAENDSRVLPPFNAYSPAGKVTGRLVYANYGKPGDFKKLAEQNISVAGKIVITRYGGTSRVHKHRHAHKAGAIGLIMYMDPQNYAKAGMDKVYPEYNWLPNTAVQRGTIKYSAFRGDPQTPGYPSIDGIYRLPIEEAKKDLPQIPVQPISYKDAAPLLRMLKGKLPDPKWQGGLPFVYGVQMDLNNARNVTLEVNTRLQVKDVYNVIGTIKGQEEPDRLVLLGNHRDAWVFGAADGSSGTAALMETSRVLGGLIRDKKWRPRRSIVLCSWGAEEPQLMGSAEWQEEFAQLLHRRSVAYLNVDMSVDGKFSFRAKSMPSMDWALWEATKKVPSPYSNETVFDEWARKLTSTDKTVHRPRVQAIRTGSDYAVFYQRLGIPCVDIRYTYDRRTSGNPLYHTVHDTFRMMSKLIDPDFRYHRVTTRVWLQLTLTLADSIVLPLNVTRYADLVNWYSLEFIKDFSDKLKAINVTLDGMGAAATNFTRAAHVFMKAVHDVNLEDALAVSNLNERLVTLERAFVNPMAIIPEKPLQRHVIWTPGYNVYSSVFGGIAEALYRVDQGTATAEDVKRNISAVVYGFRSATSVLKLAPI